MAIEEHPTDRRGNSGVATRRIATVVAAGLRRPSNAHQINGAESSLRSNPLISCKSHVKAELLQPSVSYRSADGLSALVVFDVPHSTCTPGKTEGWVDRSVRSRKRSWAVDEHPNAHCGHGEIGRHATKKGHVRRKMRGCGCAKGQGLLVGPIVGCPVLKHAKALCVNHSKRGHRPVSQSTPYSSIFSRPSVRNSPTSG